MFWIKVEMEVGYDNGSYDQHIRHKLKNNIKQESSVTPCRAKFQGYATFWATIDNPTHSD